MFIETPQDFFYIVASVVILVLGLLLTIIGIYIVFFVKKASDTARQLRQDLGRVSEAAFEVKEKLVNSGVLLTSIVTAIVKGVKLAGKWRNGKKDRE